MGLVTFADRVVNYIPAGKSRKHVLGIISKILDTAPPAGRTDLSAALNFLISTTKAEVVFILSDFMCNGFESSLATLSRKSDLIAIIIRDPTEMILPETGVTAFEDMETGEILVVDSLSKQFRNLYQQKLKKRNRELLDTLNRYGIDHIMLEKDQDYLIPLIRLFRQRKRRLVK